MKLSEKDHEKIYGKDGLFKTFLYIKTIIDSCETTDQLKSALLWGEEVINLHYKKYEHTLDIPFFGSQILYELKFMHYYQDCSREIRRYAKAKLDSYGEEKEDGTRASL